MSPGIRLEQSDLSTFLSAERYDLVIAVNVVQYLSIDRLELFLFNAAKMLNAHGKIVLAGLPNRQARDVAKQQNLGILHDLRRLGQQPVSIAKGFAARWIGDDTRAPGDGIGNWFDIDEIKQLSADTGLTCSISPSGCYPYRFHATIAS